MGVMSCHRKECESIMCDLYVDGVGYVCDDCQSEFKEFMETQPSEDDSKEHTEGEIKRQLIKFMKSPKDEFTQGEKITVDKFFSNHTRKD